MDCLWKPGKGSYLERQTLKQLSLWKWVLVISTFLMRKARVAFLVYDADYSACFPLW